jgi:hypothetical protein
MADRMARANLVKSDNQPEGLVATATGNAQTTRNGDLFVSWGDRHYLSELGPVRAAAVQRHAAERGLMTYRAYRLPWNPPAG